MPARSVLTLAALALLVLAIFAVDVATGPLVGFALFYLVPIGIAAWRIGRWPAVGIAIEAFAAWLLADMVWRPESELPRQDWDLRRPGGAGPDRHTRRPDARQDTVARRRDRVA